MISIVEEEHKTAKYILNIKLWQHYIVATLRIATIAIITIIILIMNKKKIYQHSTTITIKITMVTSICCYSFHINKVHICMKNCYCCYCYYWIANYCQLTKADEMTIKMKVNIYQKRIEDFLRVCWLNDWLTIYATIMPV